MKLEQPVIDRRRGSLAFWVLAVLAIVMAGAPMRASAAAATNELQFESAAVTGGNGNGQIDRHECNSYSVTLRNLSASPITNVTARLTTTTPGVEIAQSISTYPDFPAGGTIANGAAFQIGTASWFACGTPINLVLTVTANEFTNVVTFQQTTPVNCVDGGGACSSSDQLFGGVTTGDAFQAGRLFRTSSANSSCLEIKPFPGLQAGTGEPAIRRFDAYAFTNRSGDAACVTVDMITGCSAGASPLFCVAYLGSFNPTNLSANYLGDISRTPNPSQSFGFNVPANASVVLVVHEVNGGNGCDNYTLRVTSSAGFFEYRPPLSIAKTGADTLILTWPTNAVGFSLISLAASPVGAYSVVADAPVTVGDQYQVSSRATNTSRFFQLRKQ